VTRFSVDLNIILIFSEILCAERSREDANSDVDSHRGDDLDDDNKEAEPNSRVLAHVELARTVREFGPQAQRPSDSNLVVCQNRKPLSQISHFKLINLPFRNLSDASYMIRNILTVLSHQLMCPCMHVHPFLA
jgi:hypothetical protein